MFDYLVLRSYWSCLFSFVVGIITIAPWLVSVFIATDMIARYHKLVKSKPQDFLKIV